MFLNTVSHVSSTTHQPQYERGFLVQPYAYSFQFSLKQCSLLRSLRSIENHDNHVAGLRQLADADATSYEKKLYFCCADDLSTSALALCCTFDDTRQIQDLNLSSAILEHTRNCCERGEGV